MRGSIGNPVCLLYASVIIWLWSVGMPVPRRELRPSFSPAVCSAMSRGQSNRYGQLGGHNNTLLRITCCMLWLSTQNEYVAVPRPSMCKPEAIPCKLMCLTSVGGFRKSVAQLVIVRLAPGSMIKWLYVLGIKVWHWGGLVVRDKWRVIPESSAIPDLILADQACILVGKLIVFPLNPPIIFMVGKTLMCS